MVLDLNLNARSSYIAALGLISLVISTACGPKAGTDDPDDLTSAGTETMTGADETNETDDTGVGSDGDPSDPTEGASCVGLPSNKNIDIIFMIDDSGSMAEKQLALASNLDVLVDALEEADMNYRIAFTTSDNGNPLCPTNVKTPESGNFVLSSCRSRLDHFLFATVPPVEADRAACLDICAHETIAIKPTTTDLDPNPEARPWVERIEGQTNLPDDVSMEEALRCFAPMGIAGCGYEEQLESVHKAITRTHTAGEAQYGFLRSDATLAIVLVSDEADGSFNRSAYGSFGPYDPNGNKVFWSDPEDHFPTSAVAWNAGVECLGSGSPYTDCHAQDYDIDGNVLMAAQATTQAVFHPVSRYTDQLDAIRSTGKRVVVLGMLGVPPGYESGTPLVYRDAPEDPEFMHAFGIGAGCESPLSLPGMEPFQPGAVPPVRQREVAEAFPGRIYSICEADYGARLQDIACDLIDPAG